MSNEQVTYIARLQRIELAARALLARIDDITTDEFQKGGERAERESLRDALAEIGNLTQVSMDQKMSKKSSDTPGAIPAIRV